MNKKLVVCGDSFNYGIGCVNLNTQPYGVLTAEHFGWDLIRLARGSASNYTIYLQGLFAADMEEKPHLVILGQTSYNRIEWIAEGGPSNFWTHSLVNLNYHEYPPHYHRQPHHDNPMDYHLKDNPNYKPCILSEQIGGIDDCLKVRKKTGKGGYYTRLDTESDEKLQMIVDYNVTVFDESIKRNYDIGMLFQAYSYIKRKGINCIILTEDIDIFSKYMDKTDLLFQSWGMMTRWYPDTIGSMHTSELGHAATAASVIKKIKELNLG